MIEPGSQKEARTGVPPNGEQPSSPEARNWWQTSRSLQEIAEQLEAALKEKHDLERRLKEALNDRIALHLQYAEANAELTRDTINLQSEVAELRAQIRESIKQSQNLASGNDRQLADFAAREKLIKDEFERKLKALQSEVQTERHQFREIVNKLKSQLAGCICRSSSNIVATGGDNADRSAPTSPFKPQGTTPPRRSSWLARNSR